MRGGRVEGETALSAGVVVGTFARRVLAQECAALLLADWDGLVFTLRVEDDGRWTLVDETPAELFGVTAPRVTQIVTAHRDRVWPVSVSTGRAGRLTHADAVTDMRVAIHAQQLRAEAATSGYASELRGFYGSDKVAPSDRPEQRLTLAAARREHTARLAHERELATRHAERQRKSA